MFAAAALLALVPAFASETTTFSYDSRGRLVKVARSGTVNNGASACYTYDNADNRSNVTTSTTTDCSTAGGIGVSFSISSNGPVTEGGNSVFTITKTGTTSSSLSVNYATADGTATVGSDYTATSGTLTFTAAQGSQTVSVPTIDDSNAEPAENFSMSLSAPSGGATVSTGTATATINDNDPCGGVSYSVNDPSVTEGGNLVFTVTKSGSTSNSCSVNYATANGTATAGSDYTATSGTLTFASGQTSLTVSVPTIDDTAAESAETVPLNLSSPTGSATISDSQGVGTINDNDTVTNQPPVANSDSASTSACGTVTVNVVANDTDPDGDYPLHIAAIGYTSRGTVDSYTSTSITFTAATSSGTGEVVYTVADSRGATSDGDLLITISGGTCQ